MNHKFVIYLIGKILQIFAGVLVIPATIAVVETSGAITQRLASPNVCGFLIAIVMSLLAGTLMVALYRKHKGQINVREGFAIVTFSWLAAAFIGSMPFFIYFLHLENTNSHELILSAFTNAMFETMSGLTTFGASVIADVESLPRGILFWRQMTQWIGGLGFVTLALAMFPAFGLVAYQMFRGEMSGPEKERLRPRLAQTSAILWGVYVFFTFTLSLLFMAGDMSLYDAVCHAFTTMATGGFSTRNASIAAFDSVYIEWVTIVFMMLGGVGFLIHYRIIFHSDKNILKTHSEFHFYIGVLVVATALIAGSFYLQDLQTPKWALHDFSASVITEHDAIAKISTEKKRIANAHDAIRHAAFQVVSITTTTGYATADWNVWPNFARTILFILLFFGGCAGSTSGSIKMIRILVLLKAVIRHTKVMLQSRRVLPLKIGERVISDTQVTSILHFFALYMLLFAAATVALTIFVPDILTAASAVASAMGNVGPGLSGVGAAETYAWIPGGGKWILIVCMLLGRLEIYTVLIAFSPALWKK